LAATGLVWLGGAGIIELQSSRLQSRLFTWLARDVGWELRSGESERIRFPGHGPFDERMGYTALPRVITRVREGGFEVIAQARVSSRFAALVDRGAYPIYREKAQGGLVLEDRTGAPFFAAPLPRRVYAEFDSIPGLLWRALLHIESRELLDERYPRRNPAVEWDRLARAAGQFGARLLGSERAVPGGSTLATQLEKFRHSRGGRTDGPREKLRQMLTASLRAYHTGAETLADQRRIVRDYLNSVPLAAQVGHGEVVGTADGLRAWYGLDFDEANRLLRGRDLGPGDADRRARVVRQALSLLVAQRRPSYYLVDREGRAQLEDLTDRYLRLLARDGVIPDRLAQAALSTRDQLLDRAPQPPRPDFVTRKAANQARNELRALVGAASLYELDGWDLRARTTIDADGQRAVAAFLDSLHDRDFVRARGLAADRLLGSQDPRRVVYSFALLETTPRGNVVRIQTDGHDGPLDLGAGSRLELGSTAKLRTLVTYLEVMAELHERLGGLSADSLRAFGAASRDPLTSWAIDHRLRHPGGELGSMLEAAMARRYSANPGERFATGGGTQTFANFDRTQDGRVMTVGEAFRESVNLPWIRVMRELRDHLIWSSLAPGARALEDGSDPARVDYLSRFADLEGSRFVRRFHAKYRDVAASEILARLVAERRLAPHQLAWAYRAVAPEATAPLFREFARQHLRHASLSDDALDDLHAASDPTRFALNDFGYLSGIHPLELWVARHLIEHPHASQEETVAASYVPRQVVYRWLLRSANRGAQDRRIRTVLEIEAFQEVQARWRRLGYPFAHVVPSLGTAIGSSGDRPMALAELVGILLNDGVRYPITRVEEVHFAPETPFETRLARDSVAGERVLAPEVARVAREALLDVVENGTGRRARGIVKVATGEAMPLGGKTGTGDNRFRVFGEGGRLLEERVVNRTSTFVFFLGDRHFGVITAHVPGPEAGEYRFTSALATEVLRQLGPVLERSVAVAR
jgi:membrane peptidoglycan carboxypeptidase